MHLTILQTSLLSQPAIDKHLDILRQLQPTVKKADEDLLNCMIALLMFIKHIVDNGGRLDTLLFEHPKEELIDLFK